MSTAFYMTRTGFEPVLPPWKGGVLTAWPTGHVWRRRRDLNPRTGCPIYTLSRGASSATWVLPHKIKNGSAGRIRTYDRSVNSRLLYHWATAEQFYMVGLNGLEPSTSRLSGVRSNHLSYRPIMERVKGIEPSSTAWKAVVLPLNYTRIEQWTNLNKKLIWMQ